MANDEQIKQEADIYLETSSMEEASKKAEVSVRTLQLHLKKLEEIDPDRYVLVQNKKKSNERVGQIKGGIIGRRTTIWSENQAQSMARMMTEKDFSYRSIEQQTGIPKSTIHEMTHHTSIDSETSFKLKTQADAHRRHQSYEEYVEGAPIEGTASERRQK